MSYKTILVQSDNSRHADQRIATAARIALAENAHLVGVAMSGVSRYFYQTMALAPGDPGVAPYLDMLQKRAQDALDAFEKVVRQAGVASWEKRLVDDEPASGFSQQAHYADLAVLGQYDPEDSASVMNADLPEYVTMNGGCPVLVVPYIGPLKPVGERVLLAWNASLEAIRAVHGALPILKRAKNVDVVVFTSTSAPDAFGKTPGDDIALYLARHGIKVNVMRQTADHAGPGDIGSDLLSLATDLGSGMLVMGCYGHSRFREILLGGATRTILESMTIPVLMSH